MAFYFALFNVSNVNNELRGQRKAERKERDKRRHSLASSNCLSAAKDYRLLPKPQIVLHQPDEDDYPRVSLESINNRRSLSRDSVDRRGSNTSRTARMGSNADQLARELKKVHFRSIKRRRSKEKPNNNNAEEPIWMRRQTVDLSDSYPTDPQKRISDPWVYSIDLEENPPEAESKSRSQSLTHSESWSPESPISNSTNNTNTTLLSSPKQTWLASSETLTESSSQPSVNSEKVWHKPVMGVNALEDWDNEEVERTQEHLKDELQTHVNTWPEMNAKKK
uniref:Uncharacterized protein n=2 Tax=Bursaphelenchus xylophilus TaxID=6326 RepID=A0A1I7SCZ2_BURXY